MYIKSLKRLIIIGILLYLSYSFVYSANFIPNKNFGECKYGWFSQDSDEIGVIKNYFNIGYKFDSDCGVPTGNINEFTEIIKSACESWCEPLNLKYNLLKMDDNIEPTILVNVISRSNFLRIYLSDPANQNKNFDRKSVIGLVNRDDFSYIGYLNNNLKKINVYLINKSTIFIIWDDAIKSDYRTDRYNYEQWLRLITHELGHAIGYRGHNNLDSSKPIMYGNGNELMGWDITKPNEDDISHLKNIYCLNNY